MNKLIPLHRLCHRPAGFTLIELLITISIATILMALAVPSFSAMLKQNRLSAQTTSFINALQFARSTALTTNVPTTVCPRGAAGSVTCGTNWSSGWIVATAPAIGTATLLQSYEIGPRDPALSAVAGSGTPPASLSFDPRGLAVTSGNFKICDSRGGIYARSVQVLVTGFVQAGPTAGQAIWDNSNLSCP